MGLLDVVIAVAMGLVIWKGSVYILRMLANPPLEVDPDEVVPADQDYRCSVCGTEVTVRVANLREASPPKHCREEMDPVWRP